MKVLLIQSPLERGETPIYPIGLACLKAALPDFDVRIFDPNLPIAGNGGWQEKLAEILDGFQPDVIGISLRNIDSTNKRTVVFYYEGFVRLLHFVKDRIRAVIVVGGAGFSMFAATIMKTRPEIDFGVFLEGENAFPALLRRMHHPETVKSVYYRKNGEVRFSGPEEKADIETLPDPDMTAIDISAYARFPESVGIETKRGCPFQCIYCPYGFLNGRSHRLKDPVRIVDTLDFMVRNHGLSDFTFTDSIFNVPVNHAKMILQEMIGRNLRLSWSAWFNERELDESFVRLAVQAGCRNFIFSPDAFSDTVLRRLGKRLSRRDIVKGFGMMAKTRGCEASYNFFKNPPGQTWSAFLSLLVFCIRARWKMGKRVHFEFNSLRVEPHTALYDIAVAEGIIRTGDEVLHPVYYSQKKTAVIEILFNRMLKLAGK